MRYARRGGYTPAEQRREQLRTEAAATRPSRGGSGSHSSKLRRPPSPRPAGYRQALCQQHCGFLVQSTWCVGHAGTEAACAAVPVSITVGPAAKAVASAAEASTYVRAAGGRPCFRLIDFPFGRRLGTAARVGSPVPQGRLFSGTACVFRHSLAGAAETALKGR